MCIIVFIIKSRVFFNLKIDFQQFLIYSAKNDSVQLILAPPFACFYILGIFELFDRQQSRILPSKRRRLLNADKISVYVQRVDSTFLRREHFPVLMDADGIPYDIGLSTTDDSLNINLIGGSLPESIETSRTAGGSGCWESALKVRFRSCADSSTNQVSYD